MTRVKDFEKSKESVKCLNPHCKFQARTRGLCESCYGAARLLIKQGKTSDEELVKNKRMFANQKASKIEWLLGKEGN